MRHDRDPPQIGLRDLRRNEDESLKNELKLKRQSLI